MRKKKFVDNIGRTFVIRHSWMTHIHGCAEVVVGALYSSYEVISTNDSGRSMDEGFQVMVKKK